LRAEWAVGPQYAGEEEWGEEEEWYEEEVAFHPGEGRQASLLVEEGLLFHPEGEESTAREAVRLCGNVEREVSTKMEACARDVGFWGWLKKKAEKMATHYLMARKQCGQSTRGHLRAAFRNQYRFQAKHSCVRRLARRFR
jgi:hypothetical protein